MSGPDANRAPTAGMAERPPKTDPAAGSAPYRVTLRRERIYGAGQGSRASEPFQSVVGSPGARSQNDSVRHGADGRARRVRSGYLCSKARCDTQSAGDMVVRRSRRLRGRFRAVRARESIREVHRSQASELFYVSADERRAARRPSPVWRAWLSLRPDAAALRENPRRVHRRPADLRARSPGFVWLHKRVQVRAIRHCGKVSSHRPGRSAPAPDG